MAAIRADQEAQGRHLQSQRASLVSIITDLGSLRLMTKDTEAEPSHPGTPDPEAATSEADVSRLSPTRVAVNEVRGRRAKKPRRVKPKKEKLKRIKRVKKMVSPRTMSPSPLL